MNSGNPHDQQALANREASKSAVQAQGMISSACRQSGKEALSRVISQLREKALSLEVILNMTPTTPTLDQDQALWNLANSLR
jgi:hypothetical protein